ncbi:MAG: HAD hydrolase-like protein [Deltaproteobacteria bacterium]|nr:HAD hydrolase-like protein [Deltaproteobacteria bacterium]
MGKRKHTKSSKRKKSQQLAVKPNSDGALPNHVSLDTWRTDPRLAEPGNTIKHMQRGVLSLDFFDTLVGRLCAHPTDVFTEVGRRLRQQNLLVPWVTPLTFRELRIAAETKARQIGFWERGNTEITLAHIYHELHPHIVKEMETAMTIELSVEVDWCFVNPAVESLLYFARSLGHRVCVLSDMYLSGKALFEIATQNGLPGELISPILVSGELLQGKSSGGLFQIARQKMRCTAKQMVHLGDNPQADISGAQKAGVLAFHYPMSTANSPALFAAESRTTEPSESPLCINALRVHAEWWHNPKGLPLLSAAYQVLGPVLANWCDWCVAQLSHTGIQTVFVLMREGRLLGTMLQKSAIAQNSNLHIEELFVSRQSTLLASVGEATNRSVSERIYARTVGETFESFGLKAKDVGFPPHVANQPISSTEMLHTVVRFLTSGKIKEAVTQKSAIARKQFLAYFLPLIKTDKIALIDLGWGGTIQRNIERIFELEKISVSCTGFYLATAAGSAINAMRGSRFFSYLCHLNSPDPFARILIRSPEMIEQSVIAPIGSTTGYAEDATHNWRPVLGQLNISEKEIQNRERIQQAILTYQNTWLKLAQRKRLFQIPSGNVPSTYTLGASALQSHSRAVIERLILYPRAAEALTLGGFHHDEGIFSDKKTRIANPLNVAVLENDGYDAMSRTKGNFWPQGVMALADETLLARMATGTVWGEYLAELGVVNLAKATAMPHPTLQAQDIRDVTFSAGVWIQYTIHLTCPTCTSPFSDELMGTFTIQKTVGCPECHSLWHLGFEAILQWLQSHRPELFGGRVGEVNRISTQYRKRISDSFSTPGDVPLLATLVNRYAMYTLSQMTTDELIEGDVSK